MAKPQNGSKSICLVIPGIPGLFLEPFDQLIRLRLPDQGISLTVDGIAAVVDFILVVLSAELNLHQEQQRQNR